MKTPKPSPRSACPINLTLETVGDAWSLLIVRDMAFKGYKTYNEFLNAGESIATNILSERLRRLESVGIIDKRRDPQDARRFIYRLTEKGFDLAPLMLDMVLWAARHAPADVPEAVLTQLRSDRDGFLDRLRVAWAAGST